MSHDAEPELPTWARRHRTALIVSAVAVVLIVVGVFAAVAFGDRADAGPSSAPSVAPTESPTPTPTLEPAVVLDGDCSRLLSDATASGVIGAAVAGGPVSAFSLSSDLPASARLLGGLVCEWNATDTYRSLGVSVYPADAVSPRVRDLYASPRCQLTAICELGQVIGDFWVGVHVVPESELGDGTDAEVRGIVDALIPEISAALEGAVARPVPREATWWTTAPCAALTPTVESLLGSPIEQQFFGDAVPEGRDWDTLVDAGLQEWCPWTRLLDAEGAIILEVFVMPGAGAPTPEQLGSGSSIDVPGADQAWMNPYASGGAGIVSVVGPNRLLVKYSDSTSSAIDASTVAPVVTALITELNRGTSIEQ